MAARPNTDYVGKRVDHLEQVGVLFRTVAHDTNPFLVEGASIAVDGYVLSTAPAGYLSNSQLFLNLRAKNTANATSELLTPGIGWSTGTMNTWDWFDPPLIAAGGLSIDIGTSPTVIATVFYHYLATSNVSGSIIPPSETDGMALHDNAFIGVKVGTRVTPGGAAEDQLSAENLDFTSEERMVSHSTESSGELLYGWAAGTGTTLSFVIFRDTNSVGSPYNSNLVLPPIFYNAMTSEDTLNLYKSKNFYFKYPIQTNVGLSQRRSVATDRFRVFA